MVLLSDVKGLERLNLTENCLLPRFKIVDLFLYDAMHEMILLCPRHRLKKFGCIQTNNFDSGYWRKVLISINPFSLLGILDSFDGRCDDRFLLLCEVV